MNYKDLVHRCMIDIKQVGNLLFVNLFRKRRKKGLLFQT